MVNTEYMDLCADLEPTGYYVYGWVNIDWGGVYFYVGKGHGDRYKHTRNRNMAFQAILKNYDCFPTILENNLTEEESWKEEDRIKQEFIFERGYPIMDGEGHHMALKNMAIKRAKDKLRAEGKMVDGRPRIKVPMDHFKELFEKQQKEEITVKECCEELHISRSKWYSLVQEV